MYEHAYMRGASRAGAVTREMRLGPANFPNVGEIHPKHPRGVNGPLLPSVLDLGCGVISADLKNALLVASGVFFSLHSGCSGGHSSGDVPGGCRDSTGVLGRARWGLKHLCGSLYYRRLLGVQPPSHAAF